MAAGDLQFLEGRWYVTHSGLLRIAQRNRCSGMRTTVDKELSDQASHRWVFKATVYKSARSRGFVGYGDADPSNVSSLVHGAEMRVAETRAVNRALRKAYGIGLCSVEELGWSPRPSDPDRSNHDAASTNGNNGDHNAQPRLRDRLCLLIRQYKLDANLVKAYAADYCGTAICETPVGIWSKPSSTTWPHARRQGPRRIDLSAQQLCQVAGGCIMKRHIPGLHGEAAAVRKSRTALFLVRVDRVFFRWHPQRPFYVLSFVILEPNEQQGRSFTGRLYCTPKALWKLRWFLRDFGYDPDLMGRDEIDEKALIGLQGIVRISHTTLNHRTFSISVALLQPASGKNRRFHEVSAHEVARDL